MSHTYEQPQQPESDFDLIQTARRPFQKYRYNYIYSSLRMRCFLKRNRNSRTDFRQNSIRRTGGKDF